MRSTILSRLGITLDGDTCDIHARLTDDGTGRESLAFLGVHVRPELPRAGYWYFPNLEHDALSLAKRLGMVSMTLGRAVPS